MMAVLTWSARIVAALICAAIVIGVWKREELVRVWNVITIFDEDRIVQNFSNMNAAFLTTTLPRGDGPVTPFSQGDTLALSPAAQDWIEEHRLTSLLVLKDGEIAYEGYFQGTGADDRRISWSLAKSYLSALFGILLEEGAIRSLDAPVTEYVPLLAGGAYEGVSIRDVLMMSSGVVFDEEYANFSSDIQRMARVVALGGTLDAFTAEFTERFAAPGEVWKYVSIDTHVIGMVIRGATGRSVSELMTEKIIEPLGLEQDAYYVTDGTGVAYVLGGLNFSTRDYARFAQMFLNGGRVGDNQVVPEDWIKASTRPQAPTKEGAIGYGYQRWIPIGAEDGEYFGRGVYGQYLYIDESSDVVIVVTAADQAFRAPNVRQRNVKMMREIARSL